MCFSNYMIADSCSFWSTCWDMCQKVYFWPLGLPNDTHHHWRALTRDTSLDRERQSGQTDANVSLALPAAIGCWGHQGGSTQRYNIWTPPSCRKESMQGSCWTGRDIDGVNWQRARTHAHTKWQSSPMPISLPPVVAYFAQLQQIINDEMPMCIN